MYAEPQFPEGIIFQQDGAPPHYANIVCAFLAGVLPQRCIVRRSDYKKKDHHGPRMVTVKEEKVWCH